MSAIPTVLHYYRCRNCATVMICAIQTPTRYERCNGCRSYMRFLFSEAVETPEQQDAAELVAKQGRVFRRSPSVEPMKYTPSVREERPPVTEEEARRLEQERRERLRRLEAEHEARHEAAYLEPATDMDTIRRI